MCVADNDNVPVTADETPAKTTWRESNPELAAASAELVNRHRKERAAVEKAEDKSLRKAGRNATIRQNIGAGWNGKPDNDNIGWPLAKALKTSGEEHLLRAAMEYRRIEASANSGSQLGGVSVGDEPVQIDQRTWINRRGEIVTKGLRKITAVAYADAPPTQAARTNEDTMRPAAPVPKLWRGDERVNAMIDDKARLSRLRGALGPLLDVFEEAVLSGRTLEEIGRASGAGNKISAMGGGRALVVMGLQVVASEMQRIRMDEQAPRLRAA